MQESQKDIGNNAVDSIIDPSVVTDVEFKEIPVEKTTEIYSGGDTFMPHLYLTNALGAAGHKGAVDWMSNIDERAWASAEEKDRIFFANRALRLYLAEQEGRENITPRMLLADGIDRVKWCALMDQGVIPWLMNQFDKKGKRVQPEGESGPIGEAGPAGPDDSALAAPTEGSDHPSHVTKGEIGLPEVLEKPDVCETGFAESLPEGSTSIFDKASDGFVEQPPVWQGTNDIDKPEGEVGPIGEPGLKGPDDSSIRGVRGPECKGVNDPCDGCDCGVTVGIVGADTAAEGSVDQTARMPVKWDVPVKNVNTSE